MRSVKTIDRPWSVVKSKKNYLWRQTKFSKKNSNVYNLIWIFQSCFRSCLLHKVEIKVSFKRKKKFDFISMIRDESEILFKELGLDGAFTHCIAFGDKWKPKTRLAANKSTPPHLMVWRESLQTLWECRIPESWVLNR